MLNAIRQQLCNLHFKKIAVPRHPALSDNQITEVSTHCSAWQATLASLCFSMNCVSTVSSVSYSPAGPV